VGGVSKLTNKGLVWESWKSDCSARGPGGGGKKENSKVDAPGVHKKGKFLKKRELAGGGSSRTKASWPGNEKARKGVLPDNCQTF